MTFQLKFTRNRTLSQFLMPFQMVRSVVLNSENHFLEVLFGRRLKRSNYYTEKRSPRRVVWSQQCERESKPDQEISIGLFVDFNWTDFIVWQVVGLALQRLILRSYSLIRDLVSSAFGTVTLRSR